KDIQHLLDKLESVLEGKKGIIFDMDGTLIDSMGMWGSLDLEYLKRIGVEPKPDFHDKIRTLTIPLAAEYLYEDYHTKQTPREIEEEFKSLAGVYYRESIPLKPGVYELVKHLKKMGYKLSVATANDILMSESCLKRLGIYEDMTAIVNCDMAGATKAKPDVFHLACERMGTLISESVVFEDSLHAMQTAALAGYTVVGVYEETQKDKWNEICDITDCQVVFE
ncbi:MAG: HAD family hydrolase, partial [Wujia sp.]